MSQINLDEIRKRADFDKMVLGRSGKELTQWADQVRTDIPALLDHIASLQQQLANARRNALEEAAGILDKYRTRAELLFTDWPWPETGQEYKATAHALKHIAAAIREAKK